ncbi:uncharacterized protein LOC119030758 [Acanthopagrus latus]|uniref:uncharacterized protein LOC119030758 n=1 Tax=Acanthopagrus latus TaxID=8177 RepID=UPI00187C3B7D|nr:uncharacterized protein LOC119030758 [Acanthopagrus latus]XP_036974483.1 uncharacterized protein LOC119030758 [Acanthopagrus latus]
MAEVADFVKAPSEALLDKCTREQLLKIADHYQIEVGDKRLKDAIRSILKANLADMGVLDEESRHLPPLAASNLTFEQQKEMLLLQLEHEKVKQRTEIEKQIAIEKMPCEMEQAKLSLQRSRLELIRSGKMVDESVLSPPSESSECFDVLGNLRLLPKFNEKEPEAFFSLFERVAEARRWPDAARTVMLQCALTGKAQEAYSALSVADGKEYERVKSAVLKVYELVPEAYRQRFRTWKRMEKQTHLEFARDLTGHFVRWCSALKVETFEDLSELIVLEQFKNSKKKKKSNLFFLVVVSGFGPRSLGRGV